MASQLASFFTEKGFQFLAPVESNQVFVIFPNALANKLLTHYQLSLICKPTPETTCIRFCTSWSTTQQDVDKLKQTFQALL